MWQILQTSVIVIGIVVVSIFLSYGTKELVRRILSKFTGSYVGFAANATQLITILVGFIAAIKITNIDSTILLAMLAIVTAGISLALDQSVKDVIGGIKIILFKYYKIGEYVSFDDIKGLVLDINLFSTSLNVQPKGLVVVANSKIVDGVITNHSRLDSVRFFLLIPVCGKHERLEMLDKINEIIESHPGTMNGESKVFHLWIDGAETYRIQLEILDYDKREAVATDISIKVTELLESDGIINAS